MNYYIKGYICQFNKQDQGGDILLPTVINHNAIIPSEVKMLYQHDINRPIGRWNHIKADNYGIYAEGEIDKGFQDGEYAAHIVENGLIDGLSIGFIPIDYYYRDDGVRVLKKIDLREISIVTFPMQLGARVMVEDMELENFLEI